jgi:hypothetical protein
VDCPSCGILLVRGDGCNTITCVCGKQFSWSLEKENLERATTFQKVYPLDTALWCVKALTDEIGGPSQNGERREIDVQLLTGAKAWQHRNQLLTSRALMRWWLSNYGSCPSQVCALYARSSQSAAEGAARAVSDGMREAIESWALTHKDEVQMRKENNEAAVRSLFTSMFPSPDLRGAAAIQLMRRKSQTPEKSQYFAETLCGDRKHGEAEDNHQHFFRRLQHSVDLWIKECETEYASAAEQLECRMTDQFLIIRGHELPTRHTLNQTHTPLVSCWNLSTSNTSLTFTNNNTTVQRVGMFSFLVDPSHIFCRKCIKLPCSLCRPAR